MRGTGTSIRTVPLALLICVGAAPTSIAGGDEEDAEFRQMRARAQAALEERMNARIASGWTPKSRDEQMVTRLERYRDRLIRQQERAQTRAAFEAARAEVFLEMARRYTRVGYSRRRYISSHETSRIGGPLGALVRTREYHVVDPVSARLGAYFGERAARSKAIAAAQEYHANTYYERRIRNTGTRIAMLQKQIGIKAQLAVNAL